MVMPTGELQLIPDEEQVVGAEGQQPREFGPAGQPVLPTIEQDPKRDAPLPSLPLVPIPPDPEVVREAEIRQLIFGVPVVRLNRHSGSENLWRELVRWDVSSARTGDLHEISLLSDNDSLTRYRIFIGGINQEIPEDRQTSTPLEMKWQRTVLPPGSSVVVQVRNTDGATTITVDGVITGSER